MAQASFAITGVWPPRSRKAGDRSGSMRKAMLKFVGTIHTHICNSDVKRNAAYLSMIVLF